MNFDFAFNVFAPLLAPIEMPFQSRLLVILHVYHGVTSFHPLDSRVLPVFIQDAPAAVFRLPAAGFPSRSPWQVTENSHGVVFVGSWDSYFYAIDAATEPRDLRARVLGETAAVAAENRSRPASSAGPSPRAPRTRKASRSTAVTRTRACPGRSRAPAHSSNQRSKPSAIKH